MPALPLFGPGTSLISRREKYIRTFEDFPKDFDALNALISERKAEPFRIVMKNRA
jgi:hypothetical protein